MIISSDELYKSVVRDMIKLNNKDFNKITFYMARKKNKPAEYFIKCLQIYLRKKFLKLISRKCGEPYKKEILDKFENSTFFLSSLLYPKDTLIAFRKIILNNNEFTKT